MKPTKEQIKAFNEEYSLIVKMKRKICRDIKTLRKEARKLSKMGEKHGLDGLEKYRDKFGHLDTIVYGRVFEAIQCEET